MEELSTTLFANTHSSNDPSKRTLALVESTRSEVLRFFGASQDDYALIFTSNATSALKIVGETFPWSENGKSVFVYTKNNHTSVVGIRRYAVRNGCTFYPISTKEIESFMHDCHRGFRIDTSANNLFAYPAESNFDGSIYPLEWIERVNSGALSPICPGKFFTLLDAAAFVATSPLDLSKIKPHFVVLSFYKMMGFPTGIGALIIRKDIGDHMREP